MKVKDLVEFLKESDPEPLCPKCEVELSVMLFMGMTPDFYVCPKCRLAYDLKSLKSFATVIGGEPAANSERPWLTYAEKETEGHDTPEE